MDVNFCNSMKEFEKGDTVTLDRYNHFEDRQTVQVIGYGQMPISGTTTYKFRVDGITIESTGDLIMESKFYEPVYAHERQCRKGATAQEREDYWDNR